MIKIVLPAQSVEEAVEIRNRVRGIILRIGDSVMIVDGGVAIHTDDPVRVVTELSQDGFF